MRSAKPTIVLKDDEFAFLGELQKHPQAAADDYRPARKLVELGFAVRGEKASSYTWLHTVTDAGRAHHEKVFTADKVCGRCKTAPWTCLKCGRKTCEHFCTNKKPDKTAVCGRCWR